MLTDKDSIIQELGKWINEERLRHSIGVSRMAVKLAEHYGADVKKAELAGLVHDCAKDLSMDECLKLAKRHGYEPDEIVKKYVPSSRPLRSISAKNSSILKMRKFRQLHITPPEGRI